MLAYKILCYPVIYMSNTATNIATSCITSQQLPTFCAMLGLLTICCMGDTGGSEELAMAALVSGRGDTKRPAGAVIAPLPPPPAPQLLFRLCCCRLLLNTRGVPGDKQTVDVVHIIRLL